MKRIWERSHVEVVHSRVTTEEYNQLLEEWAEMVYQYLCQLPEKSPEVPNLTAQTEHKRTGTDD